MKKIIALLLAVGATSAMAGTTSSDLNYSMSFTSVCSIPASLAFGSVNFNPKTLNSTNDPNTATTIASATLSMNCDSSTQISFMIDDGSSDVDATLTLSGGATIDYPSLFDVAYQRKNTSWVYANSSNQFWGITDADGALNVNFKLLANNNSANIAYQSARDLRASKQFVLKNNKSLKIMF